MRHSVILLQHLDALRPDADSWTTGFFLMFFICFCVCDKQIVCPSFSLQNASLLKEQFYGKVVHVLTLIWEMIRQMLLCSRHRWFQGWLEALWDCQWKWRWWLERNFERQFYQLADIFMFLHERNKRPFTKGCEDNLQWSNQLEIAFCARIWELIDFVLKLRDAIKETMEMKSEQHHFSASSKNQLQSKINLGCVHSTVERMLWSAFQWQRLCWMHSFSFWSTKLDNCNAVTNHIGVLMSYPVRFLSWD